MERPIRPTSTSRDEALRLRLFEPLIARTTQKNLDRDFASLKDILETSAPPERHRWMTLRGTDEEVVAFAGEADSPQLLLGTDEPATPD